MYWFRLSMVCPTKSIDRISGRVDCFSFMLSKVVIKSCLNQWMALVYFIVSCLVVFCLGFDAEICIGSMQWIMLRCILLVGAGPRDAWKLLP